MRRFLRVFLAVGYPLVLAVLLVDVLLVSANLSRIAEEHQALAGADELGAEFEHVLSLLKDAETGQRGYLLTGSDRYLDPFREASGGLDVSLARLKALTSGGEAQPKRVDALSRVVAEKLAELRQTIDLRRENRLDEAVRIVRSDRGKRLMDRAREIVAEAQADADNAADRSRARSALAVRRTYATFLATTGMAMAALLAFALLRRREWRRRQLSAAQLARSEAWLTTTLTSIGDALIATDSAGRVRFMNPVAEALTGWSQEEAVGRPMGDTFVIVNEFSRDPVEHPVERVIRDGVVVGLANHTVLIARDGSETPIEDSAAPIRGEDGEVAGVVMVFRDVTRERAARSQLEASEARKAAVLEGALDAIITIDQEGRVLEFNPAAEEIFGRSREEIVGQDMCEAIIAPSHRPTIRAGLARCRESGEFPVVGRRIEVQGLRSDGGSFPAELAITPISLEGPPVFTAFARDITAKKLAESRRAARLRVNELLAAASDVTSAAPEILRALCDGLEWEVGLFWLVDRASATMRCRASWLVPGRTLDGFEAASRAFSAGRGVGLPGKVWEAGRPLWITDMGREPSLPRAALAAEVGLHGAFAFPIFVGDEILGVIECFSRTVRDPDADLLEMVGTIGGQIGLCLKRAEAAVSVRASEERLRLAQEAAGMGTWEWTLDDNRVEWSSNLDAIHGIEPGTFPGTFEAYQSDIHPDDRPRVLDSLNRAVTERGTHHLEYRLVLPSGQVRWVEARGQLFRDAHGVPRRMIGVCIDITERKRDDRERERLVSVIEHSPDFIGLAGEDRRFSFLNQAGRRLVGLGDDAPIDGTSMLDCFPPDERARVEREILPALRERGRWDGEVAFANFRTGARIPVLWDVFTLPDADTDQPSQLACVSRDIAERKRAEQRLAFLADAGTTLASSLDYKDTLGNIARLATGGFADFCFFDLVLDDDRIERVAWSHADPDQQASMDRIWRLGKLDADAEHPVARVIATGRTEYVPRVDEDWLSRTAGDPDRFELLRGLRLSSLICVPVPSRGRIVGALTFCQSSPGRHFDISDARLAEDLGRRAGVSLHNALLYREAEAANRAKSQFLAVLSHELRTPLNPILLAVTSMLERPTPPEEVRPNLEMIRQYVNLQARLIDDLLDVMRIVRGKMPLHWEVADCHALLKQAIQICQSEVFGKRLRLVLELDAEHHHINTDTARLQQVFWNLIKNAVKFTTEGLITVRTRNEVRPDGREERLIVEISDTGIGVEPDALERIFDPFQQGETSITRRFGGLGLGLAISKGIVEGHGGTLTAESAGKGCGTTFRIDLATLPDPKVREQTRPGGDSSNAAGAPARSLEILLVEDEQATLRLMARLLRGLGHRVTTAGTIGSALESERCGHFDLIVSDIGLPDGSGLDLMREVVARRGPLPAIALTGYGMEEDIQRSRESGFTAHMTKPIDFTKLEAMIRQVAS